MSFNYYLSKNDLSKARETFLENEPRDLFYRVATELIDFSIEGKTEISLSESLAVLLQTWNKAYYQYRDRGFDKEHFDEIERLVENYAETIIKFRNRSILSFCKDDENIIVEIFGAFEKVLGPVGTAKSLHLLAPQFFPIWDRTIAEVYGTTIGGIGANACNYCNFMAIARKQCEKLQKEISKSDGLLKRIDEYNYCHYTKGWI